MPSIRKMVQSDLDSVLEIEKLSYPVPWTRGIFEDCLRVNYPSWVLIKEEKVVAYILFSVGADEAHLLNICVSPAYRQQGFAKTFLMDRIDLLKEKDVQTVFLEVRISSKPAIALYESLGFEQIGIRRQYYKNLKGKEDALTFKLELI